MMNNLKIITIKIETESEEKRIFNFIREKILYDFPIERIKLLEVVGFKETIRKEEIR